MKHDERLLTAEDVLIITGYKSRASLWRRCRKDSNFPKPVKVGINSIRWRASELNAWLQNLPQQNYK